MGHEGAKKSRAPYFRDLVTKLRFLNLWSESTHLDGLDVYRMGVRCGLHWLAAAKGQDARSRKCGILIAVSSDINYPLSAISPSLQVMHWTGHLHSPLEQRTCFVSNRLLYRFQEWSLEVGDVAGTTLRLLFTPGKDPVRNITGGLVDSGATLVVRQREKSPANRVWIQDLLVRNQLL